jgi:hypothetical protein
MKGNCCFVLELGYPPLLPFPSKIIHLFLAYNKNIILQAQNMLIGEYVMCQHSTLSLLIQ